ncbi:MIZ/SP-RING zinc finger protein [Colletotrichum tofieldiae]|nr:MIZ/SP-RING zinc finger protein [Colletotrichum tofieldiae]
MAEHLDSFVRFCGGLNKIPDDGTSRPRILLLKDAIETGDYFYIVLHQILCVWSIDREAAHRLLGLAPDVAESALSIIQNTLRKNENMTQRLVHFFATFPNTRSSGLWETEVFRKHASDVSVFLNNLHEQWNRIHMPAMRSRSGRGYPILADELHYQLKLRSPLLESIFFTVTRRHIGVPDGRIADQMMALFRQDAQNDHARVATKSSNSSNSNCGSRLILRRPLECNNPYHKPCPDNRPCQSK